MTGPNKERVNFRLSPELTEKLRGATDKYHPTMTALVEWLLWKYFDGTTPNRLTDLLIKECRAAWETQIELFSDVNQTELNGLIEKYLKERI